MNPMRRPLLAALAGIAGLGTAGALALWPDEGLLNPCLAPQAERWRADPLVRAALDGLDPAALWDVHAHLLPVGTAIHLHGPWPWPVMYAQARLQDNAACVAPEATDPVRAFLGPLVERLAAMPPGARVMLLAMDDFYDERGRIKPERTHFSVSNDTCAAAVRIWPDRFAWAASVHPHRGDALEELARVRGLGARALKWIPQAQGIDPASPRCDAIYRALAASGLPLITHGGDERATAGDDALGNPLRLRRALDAGVKVIVAHCATMGHGADLDRGPNAPARPNFTYFERLMADDRYRDRLFGDLSAIPQRARSGPVLATLLERGAVGGDWQRRLLYGSDHPIPGAMPLFSVRELASQGYLADADVDTLRTLRRHNAWLFDLVLKRRLRHRGRGFAPDVFATRRVLEPRAS
ncbi:MAG: amidohydrolase [Burkholderiaceae bacterium]|nr:amidohydrolase [Burkholderiaceae bacterium]